MCPRGLRRSAYGKEKKKKRIQIQSDFLPYRNDASPSHPQDHSSTLPGHTASEVGRRARVDNSEHLQLPLGKLQTPGLEFLV